MAKREQERENAKGPQPLPLKKQEDPFEVKEQLEEKPLPEAKPQDDLKAKMKKLSEEQQRILDQIKEKNLQEQVKKASNRSLIENIKPQERVRQAARIQGGLDDSFSIRYLPLL
mmetsp:Transcript_3312/g.5019  ORF Transcript_3312/g.5019 Transcript_3312/m.5019 type:complete len:114 (+) Transcript_3312:477-818(+)|eukprot:CAMPEP_0170486050 /NCGR_PEP_ID=MMETSP0208-20121228/5171_1 /TAXON_ID=197538 /ORGANISM="Strombidium inclinatum, Strain S3" /LENGTH=113 /DNA_ID=CAMNT_0010759883 /DNA_START=723 /DNA_END=1064 /DNA_ORIENTATION=-